MKKVSHTEADRSVWVVYIVQYTAEALEMPVIDTVELLDKHGLIEKALAHYDVYHTQGFEYMAEVMIDQLRVTEGA